MERLLRMAAQMRRQVQYQLVQGLRAHPQAVPVVNERQPGRARQRRAHNLLHDRLGLIRHGVRAGGTALQLHLAGQQQVGARVLGLRAGTPQGSHVCMATAHEQH